MWVLLLVVISKVGSPVENPDELRALVAPHLAQSRDTPACTPARSVGLPWRGNLKCGQLPHEHPRLRFLSLFFYATAQTHQAVTKAATFLDENDPGGPAIDVFDYSPAGGGKTVEHISHQSGRDVDFAYIYKDGYQPPVIFFEAPIELVDTKRTWLFIQGLLKTGQVKLILVDYQIQALLYEEATIGDKRLKATFQYPDGPKSRGILHHYPHHSNHFHVRFKCPPTHKRCRG